MPKMSPDQPSLRASLEPFGETPSIDYIGFSPFVYLNTPPVIVYVHGILITNETYTDEVLELMTDVCNMHEKYGWELKTRGLLERTFLNQKTKDYPILKKYLSEYELKEYMDLRFRNYIFLETNLEKLCDYSGKIFLDAGQHNNNYRNRLSSSN